MTVTISGEQLRKLEAMYDQEKKRQPECSATSQEELLSTALIIQEKLQVCRYVVATVSILSHPFLKCVNAKLRMPNSLWGQARAGLQVKTCNLCQPSLAFLVLFIFASSARAPA